MTRKFPHALESALAAHFGQVTPPAKKKLGFSKTAYIFNWAFVLAVTVAALVYAWCGKDTSIFSYICGGAWGEIAVHSAFLIRKSEKENTEGGIVYEMAMKEESKPRRTKK